MGSKNRWQLFVDYAKAHPKEIPKNNKQRSEYYKKLINECVCGKPNKLCALLQVFGVMEKNTLNSQGMLRAKLKAYEEIIEARDEEIQELIAIIEKLGKNKLGKPGTY
jgi:hypothetical protein